MRGDSRRLWAEVRGHWVALFGIVGVVALVIAVNPVKVVRALAGADIRLLALMLPVALLLYLLHGVAWSIVLRAAHAQVGVPQAIRVTFISQALVFLPGGDLWRVPIVKSEEREAPEPGAIAATVVFDDLVYLFVLTFAMVPLVFGSTFLLVPLAIALLPQLAIFTILLWPSLYDLLAGPVGRIKVFRRFQPEIDVLGPSFRQLVSVRTLVPVVTVDALCAGLSVALYGVGLAAVHAIGVSVQQVAFTYAGSQVVSGLTVMPGALGAYEGMMTGAMALQGVAPAAAAAGALLYRAVNDVFMALIGIGIALIYDRQYVKNLVSPAQPAPF